MNKKLDGLDELREILIPESCDPTLQLPDANLLQFYEDRQNRIYWLCGEICNDCMDLVAQILRWNREDRGVAVEERKPIRLIVSSPGGSLEMERTLVSIIEASKTPVHAIGIGPVASAASLIYLACHKRYATKNCYFLFHKGSVGNVEGGFNEVQAMMDDYKKQIKEMEEFYIKHTTFPKKTITKNLQSDWYVYLDDAKKYNVIDEVIEDLEVLM